MPLSRRKRERVLREGREVGRGGIKEKGMKDRKRRSCLLYTSDVPTKVNV